MGISRSAVRRWRAAGPLLIVQTAIYWINPAVAQVPKLAEIDQTLSCAHDLMVERERLEEKLANLQQRANGFRKQCSHFEVGSATESHCRSWQADLEGLRLDYVRQAQNFNQKAEGVTGCKENGLAVLTSVPNGVALPQPDWSCYCEYRFIRRPDGRTHPEVVRTPEQERAFEALKASDRASERLTKARDAFFAADPPATAAEKAAIEVILKQMVMLTLEQELLPSEVHEYLEDARKLKRILITVEVAHGVHDTVQKAKEGSFEWYQAQKELVTATEEYSSTLKTWSDANEEAKNVPRIEYILSKPFAISFSYRAGDTVAILRRSQDGITKVVPPSDSSVVTGSWNSN